MNRLLEMEVFIKVVDSGSISAAAERMDVVKSAVSKRLNDLESRLGVVLLNRTTRRMSLTDAGREFYVRSQEILNSVEDAESSLSDIQENLSGRIRLAVPLSFGLEHIGPALHDFMQQHPDLMIDVDFNDGQVDLVDEGFDLGIRIAKLSDSSLVARPLTSIRRVVCASPGYWVEHGRPETPEQLKNHIGLRYSLTKNRSWPFIRPDGTRGSVIVPTRSSANNGLFLSQAAANGAGVVCMPVFIVYQLIESGALEPVLLDYQWADLKAWAVYPDARYLPHRVRALIDFLKARFGEKPYWERCLDSSG